MLWSGIWCTYLLLSFLVSNQRKSEPYQLSDNYRCLPKYKSDGVDCVMDCTVCICNVIGSGFGAIDSFSFQYKTSVIYWLSSGTFPLKGHCNDLLVWTGHVILYGQLGLTIIFLCWSLFSCLLSVCCCFGDRLYRRYTTHDKMHL